MARRDPEVVDLLDQFVCVRVVQAYGLDLSLFQFDTEQTWAVFFLAADRTVLGRYGTRSGKDALRDVTVAGFRKACEGALDLHERLAAVKPALAGKAGPAPRWATPEKMPAIPADRAVRADGSRSRCIHCHDVGAADLLSRRQLGLAVEDPDFWPYPKPDALGLRLGPNERATVEAVAPDSPAAIAGFRTGDAIRTLNGQPLLSVADVQWVLHHAPESGAVTAEVVRGGKPLSVRLPLTPGWRRAADVTWRTSLWPVRFQVAGFKSDPTTVAGAAALTVTTIAPTWLKGRNELAAKTNLQKGDVIVAVNGDPKPLATEGLFLAHLMQRTKPGDEIALTVRRGGAEREVRYKVK